MLLISKFKNGVIVFSYVDELALLATKRVDGLRALNFYLRWK